MRHPPQLARMWICAYRCTETLLLLCSCHFSSSKRWSVCFHHSSLASISSKVWKRIVPFPRIQYLFGDLLKSSFNDHTRSMGLWFVNLMFLSSFLQVCYTFENHHPCKTQVFWISISLKSRIPSHKMFPIFWFCFQ